MHDKNTGLGKASSQLMCPPICHCNVPRCHVDSWQCHWMVAFKAGVVPQLHSFKYTSTPIRYILPATLLLWMCPNCSLLHTSSVQEASLMLALNRVAGSFHFDVVVDSGANATVSASAVCNSSKSHIRPQYVDGFKSCLIPNSSAGQTARGPMVLFGTAACKCTQAKGNSISRIAPAPNQMGTLN